MVSCDIFAFTPGLNMPFKGVSYCNLCWVFVKTFPSYFVTLYITFVRQRVQCTSKTEWMKTLRLLQVGKDVIGKEMKMITLISIEINFMIRCDLQNPVCFGTT